jgi:hypothetical protein
MAIFNSLILDLDLLEIPFSGRSFTWSNMQLDPLVVKLDWVFTSFSWGLTFPVTSVQPLSKPISDHCPYVINIGSSIPKDSRFRFENYWLEHVDFLKTVELHWNSTKYFADSARTICVKFKQVRQGLRSWRKNISNICRLIYNSNSVLLLDGLED